MMEKNKYVHEIKKRLLIITAFFLVSFTTASFLVPNLNRSASGIGSLRERVWEKMEKEFFRLFP